jgi:hypothetical protein
MSLISFLSVRARARPIVTQHTIARNLQRCSGSVNKKTERAATIPDKVNVHSHSQSNLGRLDDCGFRDGYFPFQGAEIKDRFEAIKCEFDPSLVLTHWHGDAHQDHRLVAQLVNSLYTARPRTLPLFVHGSRGISATLASPPAGPAKPGTLLGNTTNPFLSERPLVMRELSVMGITAGSLFPGLDGACEELRERFFQL